MLIILKNLDVMLVHWKEFHSKDYYDIVLKGLNPNNKEYVQIFGDFFPKTVRIHGVALTLVLKTEITDGSHSSHH